MKMEKFFAWPSVAASSQKIIWALRKARLGWDPKGNGALIIVLWNTLILHARTGGLVKQRGLTNLAVFGNIVTSWSWFGVNMLGGGLHSYGFMAAAFWWLLAFVASQIVFILIGQLAAGEMAQLQAADAGVTAAASRRPDAMQLASEMPSRALPPKCSPGAAASTTLKIPLNRA